MRVPVRLAIYGAGLVATFGGSYGLAGVIVPDSVVQSWTQQSQMNEHSEGEGVSNDDSTHTDGGMDGHDHPADGGAPPAGIQEAADPTYPVGTTVRLSADHMPGMDGAEATISGAFTTTTYSVSYTPTDGGQPVADHKWVVHEELESPGEAPLADGTEVVLEAEHMTGMQGATATIDHSTQETVYMVDIPGGEMPMTNHKWVVESEVHPAG
ncbi:MULTISPECIES: YdhK family protein [Brachybacterium]|uniref:YdhK family protein n=1 Tax=Brachybacterium kimchii TaxID=2942909 RepID=A0ABY4N7S4_9MICO|nr:MULTISPECIES: YdhK family protein [Brachybacterium]MCG7308024.1 YdhK family protein [Brachybacterium sp. ACRRE]UQN30606.1 YdhK family protein [Brachybacterium kimchii]